MDRLLPISALALKTLTRRLFCSYLDHRRYVFFLFIFFICCHSFLRSVLCIAGLLDYLPRPMLRHDGSNAGERRCTQGKHHLFSVRQIH